MSLDLEVLGNKNFFEFVETKIANNKLTNCRHVGSVIAFDGYVVTVSSLPCIVGSLCSIENESGSSITGEVVRIGEAFIDIVPHDNSFAISIGDKVSLLQVTQDVDVGPELLGRVVDGLGNPLDQENSITCKNKLKLNGTALNPFQRAPITDVLDVGIRSINSNLTLGRGQRIGIIAGSGVGKSVLLSMILFGMSPLFATISGLAFLLNRYKSPVPLSPV